MAAAAGSAAFGGRQIDYVLESLADLSYNGNGDDIFGPLLWDAFVKEMHAGQRVSFRAAKHRRRCLEQYAPCRSRVLKGVLQGC
jgi:hypothetical protein